MGVPWDHHEVEARWQSRWEADRLTEVDTSALLMASGAGQARPTSRVFYNLTEFPYPSAEGLHIGHAMTYCGADVVGRWRRMCGDTVFQPMAFDAFGINAENYALKRDEHPATVIARATRYFRHEQLDRLGCAWNWREAATTTNPGYYRWTQWLFLRLFEAGLAYQAEAPVTWCPSCQTVLAHEQVEDDACERCGTVVTERVMRQWFLRITAYADRLLAGLDDLDWPERGKNIQRRWIENLHDWLISRQRYWGPPIPIIHCREHGAVPVPEDQLPVLLPDTDNVRPTGDGRSPLAAVEEWVATTCPRCGGPARRETDVSDTFFDSSWYFLRYPSADIEDRPWDDDRTRTWLPVDLYAGGPEHVARHHLYARFVTMALHDMGLVPFAEPFPKVRLHGFITRDGHKMGKSKGNVVRPEDYIESHGADVLRLYLFFCCRWEDGGDWRDEGMVGVERFLSRLWRLVESAKPLGPVDAAGDVRVGDVVDRVTDSIRRLKFNTAIAALMGLVNRADAPRDTASLAVIVKLLAPLAPYVAEEMWARLGGPYSIHRQCWPS
jgi:leucyl-tRNA synthetase